MPTPTAAEDKIAKYTVQALVTNCFLQEPLSLAVAVEAAPVDPPMSFGSETNYALAYASAIGANVDQSYADAVHATVSGSEPLAVVRVWDVEADSAEGAETASREAVGRACDVLSVLSGNSVVPIALVLNSGTTWSVRMLPPTEGKLTHLGGGIPDTIPAMYAKAEASDAFGLLLRLFRSAQQARQPQFRIFQHVLMLEVASEAFGGDLSEKIAKLLGTVDVKPTHFAIFNQLPSDAMAATALARFRHVVAHTGRLDAAVLDKPADLVLHPLVTDLDALAVEVRRITQTVIALLAIQS